MTPITERLAEIRAIVASWRNDVTTAAGTPYMHGIRDCTEQLEQVFYLIDVESTHPAEGGEGREALFQSLLDGERRILNLIPMVALDGSTSGAARHEIREVFAELRNASPPPQPAPAFREPTIEDAIRARDKLFCEAVVATIDSSGPRLVNDTEKMMHHFNTHRPDKTPALTKWNTRVHPEPAQAQVSDVREAIMRVMRVERDHAVEVFYAADGQSSPKTREEFRAAWDALNLIVPALPAPLPDGRS